MVQSPSAPNKSSATSFGRIRVDDATSADLIMVLERALREADEIRHDWSGRGVEKMAHSYNQHMRRLRRVIHELQRTRDEMGWSSVQLSELAERR